MLSSTSANGCLGSSTAVIGVKWRCPYKDKEKLLWQTIIRLDRQSQHAQATSSVNTAHAVAGDRSRLTPSFYGQQPLRFFLPRYRQAVYEGKRRRCRWSTGKSCIAVEITSGNNEWAAVFHRHRFSVCQIVTDAHVDISNFTDPTSFSAGRKHAWQI